MSVAPGPVAGLILAAGGASRFGAQKLLADAGGARVIDRVATAAAEADLDRVVCVLGSDAAAVEEVADLRGAEVVVCEAWSEGQAASLRAGVEALSEAAAIVVLLGDQPLVTPAAIRRVVDERDLDAVAVRATYGGTPSHPTLLERPLFGYVAELRGDVGARALFEGREVRLVPCDDVASPLDVDTPADLAAVRDALAAGGSPGPR